MKDEFIWPQEQKLIEFKVEELNPEVDLSKLLFILHSQIITGSDKLTIISNTISHQGVTAIIQNLSSNPFLLNPDTMLGHLVTSPQPHFIPRSLPSLELRTYQKHSSSDGLYSQRQTFILNNDNRGGKPVEERNSDNSVFDQLENPVNMYEGTTNLTNFIRSNSKDQQVISGCKNFPKENQKFDLLVMTLRCLKQKGASKNLVPMHILLRSI